MKILNDEFERRVLELAKEVALEILEDQAHEKDGFVPLQRRIERVANLPSGSVETEILAPTKILLKVPMVLEF